MFVSSEIVWLGARNSGFSCPLSLISLYNFKLDHTLCILDEDLALNLHYDIEIALLFNCHICTSISEIACHKIENIQKLNLACYRFETVFTLTNP